MNASGTGYYEADVDDLDITAHKGLKQRLFMAIETIQQVFNIETISRHRKIQDGAIEPEQASSRHRNIQDEARDSEQTSSNKNTANDIKGLELNGQRAVVEQADSSALCKNVTNLEIVVCDANETYFVIIDNTRTSLERPLSTLSKSFLTGSRFLDSLEEGATTLVRSLTLDVPASVPFVIRNPSFGGSFALDSKGCIPKKRKIVINVNNDEHFIQCIFESDPFFMPKFF